MYWNDNKNMLPMQHTVNDSNNAFLRPTLLYKYHDKLTDSISGMDEAAFKTSILSGIFVI